MCAPYAGITRVRFDGYVLRLGRADRTTPDYQFDDSSARCPRKAERATARPDGSGRPRSATVVIQRRDGGMVGA
jgi:hypothetical protein